MVNSPQIGQFLKFVEELLKIKLHQRTTFIRALLCRCKTATTCKLQAFIEPQLDQMGFNIAAACSVCHKKLLLLLLLLLLYPNLSGTHCQQCNLSSSAKNGCRINCINKQQDGLYRRKNFYTTSKKKFTNPSTNVEKASRIMCSHNASLTAFGIGTRWLMRSRCWSNKLSS